MHHAVSLLSELPAFVPADVTAPDGSDADELPLCVRDAEITGEAVSLAAPSGVVSFGQERPGLRLRQAWEAHAARGVADGPDWIAGRPVVPNPGNEPSVEVVRVGGTHIFRVRLNLSLSPKLNECGALALHAEALRLAKAILRERTQL
jgi:hypothetical protein